jgi:hypothetical protein
MATCIDLRERFGSEYRIENDPAYEAEYGRFGRTEDPWMLTIPCKFGEIFPWGGDRLAFGSNGRGSTANQVAGLPFVRVEQDGSDGFTVSFHVDHFAEVAAIVRPKRRRRLSSSHKAALAAGSAGRFGRPTGSKCENHGRVGVQAA